MNAYLDNAATTFPKPECVPRAMYEFMTTCGANVGRGSYASAFDIEGVVLETREALASLFGAPDARDIVFTRNVTESLNLLIKGLLHEGDHVIVSSMEHNAVMRPLVQLESRSVSFTRCPCDETGMLDIDALAGCLRPNTRAVVMLHASNVTGTVMPVAKVGEFCRAHGLAFILDSAQTAGVLPINMEVMGIDAVAFTGHKGLLGPQGIGGVALTEELAHRVEPLVVGGTGSVSDKETIPRFMPDRLEAGTPTCRVSWGCMRRWSGALRRRAVLCLHTSLALRSGSSTAWSRWSVPGTCACAGAMTWSSAWAWSLLPRRGAMRPRWRPFWTSFTTSACALGCTARPLRTRPLAPSPRAPFASRLGVLTRRTTLTMRFAHWRSFWRGANSWGQHPGGNVRVEPCDYPREAGV